jgi:parallel beta-helix repeat protein
MHAMNRKLIFALGVTVLLFSLPWVRVNLVEVKASNGDHVHNLSTGLNYTTIQAAIDAASTLNGHTIFVNEGTYLEHVTIGKSISLVGENRDATVIDGNETDTAIHITVNGVTVRGFAIKNSSTGVYVDSSNDSVIAENNIVDNNGDGVFVSYSKNCSVYNNTVGNNTGRGILFTNTWSFTASNNTVYGSGVYGLNANSSMNGLITANNVYQNYFDGIGLYDSNSCRVIGNSISNNTLFGISSQNALNASIYHNNIIDNGIQVAVAYSAINWDDGVEGNYWSDYKGNDTDQNGISDSPYGIFGEGGTDNFPLMGKFNGFDTSYGYQVNIISNSSIFGFGFGLVNASYAALTFNITGEVGTQGFCRLRVPKVLINGSYTTRFDGMLITSPQVRELPPSNKTFEYFYINYTHSDHRIEIAGTTALTEPETPPSSMLIPILIVATLIIVTLLAVIVYRRKQQLEKSKNNPDLPKSLSKIAAAHSKSFIRFTSTTRSAKIACLKTF